MLMPPGAPQVMKGLPSGVNTTVGDMEERGHFPGSTELEYPEPTTKSPSWLLRKNPYPSTYSSQPQKELMVWVMATIFPALSATQKDVVFWLSSS